MGEITKPKRILIIKLSAVGDCVHTLYVLRALRDRFPSAQIDWAIENKSYPIVAGHPDASTVHLIDRKSGNFAWYKSVSNLKTLAYDVTIDLSGLVKSGYLAWATGAPERIGFDRWREGNRIFNNRRVKTKSGHMIDRYFGLLAPLGDFEIPPAIEIAVSENDQAYVDDFFEKQIPPDRPVVALNPHGTWPNKLYPLKKYAQVADRLIQNGATVLLVWGGQSEHDAVKQLAAMMTEPAVVAPSTDLKQLYALLKRCTIYLGNDSGPMHMAAAADIGVLGIFGPTNPARVGPWAARKREVTAEPFCEKWPCEKKKCDHPNCIDRIDPEKIVACAVELLGECQ
jgi:lipopolysaccharide heptosyltransferase I